MIALLEIYYNVLLESQIEDIITYRNRNATKNLTKERITYLNSLDPTATEGKTGKYTSWLVKRIKELPEEYSISEFAHFIDWNNVPENLKSYDKYKQFLNDPKLKDINNIRSFPELSNICLTQLKPKIEKYKEKQETKEAIKDTKKLFENDKWLVIQPQNQKAQRYWCSWKNQGEGADWCIAREESHYNLYKSNNFMYIVLNKKDPMEKYEILVQKDMGGFEIWNFYNKNILNKKEFDELFKWLEKRGIDKDIIEIDENIIKEQELFIKAQNGDGSILNDPLVSKIKDNYGFTPLHLLALYSKEKEIQEKILNHKDVSKIKNDFGSTPLHLLALYSQEKEIQEKILNHEDVGKIKNIDGYTPLHFLAIYSNYNDIKQMAKEKLEEIK